METQKVQRCMCVISSSSYYTQDRGQEGLEWQADRNPHRSACFLLRRHKVFTGQGQKKKQFITQDGEDKEIFILKDGLFIVTSSKQHWRAFTHPAQIYRADNLLRLQSFPPFFLYSCPKRRHIQRKPLPPLYKYYLKDVARRCAPLMSF